MHLNKIEKNEFIHYIQDILQSQQFQETKNYCQHGHTSTYTHSVLVSCYSYWLSLRLPIHFDSKSIARGALLHDFYLYDWHIPHKSHKLHGFSHAGVALNNANIYFELNRTEKAIIKCHMWPLNITKIPRNREALLVCFVDKFCSFAETFHIPLLPEDNKCSSTSRLYKNKLSLKSLFEI